MATPALLTLLEVQACDTTADQLAHRRATLPTRATLAALTASSATLDEQLEALEPGIHALERSQKRLEDGVATTEDKAAATERQLYSGTVTAPRELQAMQDELASLRRRIGKLEDELLEVMEQREPLDADLARLRAEQEDVSARAAAVSSELAADEAAIDGELGEVRTQRRSLGDEVPAELLARYEKIRARSGGVGIARLDGNRCTGCHLVLPNREVDELRRAPADEIVLHDECGRILVRD